MDIVNKLFSLEDKVIIVAGGAGQIGIELCNILVDMKATVIIADLDIDMAKEKIKNFMK